MEKVGSLSEKTEEENVSQITEVVTEFVEPEIVEEEVVEEKKPTTIIDDIKKKNSYILNNVRATKILIRSMKKNNISYFDFILSVIMFLYGASSFGK